MKKLSVLFISAIMMIGLATSAMAAYQVEVKTNSEGVTASAGACEKAGNITFIFDASTDIKSGDWWTADLPIGVTLCTSTDFMILGNGAAAGATAPFNGGFAGSFQGNVAADDGATTSRGIWAVKDAVAGDGINGNVTVTAGRSFYFRVTGVAGSSRLQLTAVANAANMSDTTNTVNGGVTFSVNAGTEFQIKLFDSFDANSGGNYYAYNDMDKDGLYGDGATGKTDILKAVNDYDNSYCIAVDSTKFSASTVNVSINSGGNSGNNFLTFNPANPQVAHLISAATIQLAKCKSDEYGFVSLSGGQSAVCSFDYDSATSYCTDQGSAVFTKLLAASGGPGGRMIIQNTAGTFYNAGDQFRVVLRVSGNGAYWGSAGAALAGYKSTDTKVCAGGAGNAIGAAFTPTTESGVTFTTYATGASCGTIAASSAVTTLTSAVFTGIDTYTEILASTPVVVFDKSKFVEGSKVTVTVQLYRLPCGKVFEGTRTIAEFKTTCPTAAPTTKLVFPYSTELNGASGWWFGISFSNPTAVAGAAKVTVYEADGDKGEYTVASVPAYGQVTWGGADLLALLTKTAGSGTLGDSRTFITVDCSFAGAVGFGMTGNGTDSTGYAANGNSASYTY